MSLICLLIGHADTEYRDVESRAPGATFKHCGRCGREDPPRP